MFFAVPAATINREVLTAPSATSDHDRCWHYGGMHAGALLLHKTQTWGSLRLASRTMKYKCCAHNNNNRNSSCRGPRTIIVPWEVWLIHSGIPLSLISGTVAVWLCTFALLGSGSLSSSVFSGRIFGDLGARQRFRDGCFALLTAQRRFQDALCFFEVLAHQKI